MSNRRREASTTEVVARETRDSITTVFSQVFGIFEDLIQSYNYY